MSKRSKGEQALYDAIVHHHPHMLEGMEEEYWFAKPRRWRFDFAWPDIKVACEVEGVSYRGAYNRHQTGVGYERDCEKYTTAALMGWTVVRVTTRQIAYLRNPDTGKWTIPDDKGGDAARWLCLARGECEGDDVR